MSDGEENNMIGFDDPPRDFAIAQQLPSRVIEHLRDGFAESWDSPRTTVNQTALQEYAPSEYTLSARAVEAVFVGLATDAEAEQISTGDRYADYTFRVSPELAARTLDRQYVAALAIEEVTERSRESAPDVSLVATLPDGVTLSEGDAVGAISARARDLVLGASDTVRIANPYFDADQRIVDDLASLPQQGVNLRVLTRETENPDDDLVDALNTLHEGLDREGRSRLEVRDLYEETDWGRHKIATHAKLAIVDETNCYVGSANLTRTNLSANFEFGIIVKGPPASRTAAVFDDVFAAADPVELPLIG